MSSPPMNTTGPSTNITGPSTNSTGPSVIHITQLQIPQARLRIALIICFILSTAFLYARMYARKRQVRRYAWEDYFSWFALWWTGCLTVLWLGILKTYYWLVNVGNGVVAPNGNLQIDTQRFFGVFFTTQLLLYLTLWSVKFSYLMILKQLIDGVKSYHKPFYYITGFIFCLFLGCIASTISDCRTPQDWFIFGGCSDARDTWAQAINLYYSLAADLLSDLLIMFFPIRLIIKLEINRWERLGIGLTYTCVLLKMAVAIARLLSLKKEIQDGQIAISWLVIWGAVESLIALLVNALPAFSVFVRKRVVDVVRSQLHGTTQVHGEDGIDDTAPQYLDVDDELQEKEQKEWPAPFEMYRDRMLQDKLDCEKSGAFTPSAIASLRAMGYVDRNWDSYITTTCTARDQVESDLENSFGQPVELSYEMQPFNCWRAITVVDEYTTVFSPKRKLHDSAAEDTEYITVYSKVRHSKNTAEDPERVSVYSEPRPQYGLTLEDTEHRSVYSGPRPHHSEAGDTDHESFYEDFTPLRNSWVRPSELAHCTL